MLSKIAHFDEWAGAANMRNVNKGAAITRVAVQLILSAAATERATAATGIESASGWSCVVALPIRPS